MPLWQAIILGAVQGLTEFLPISSTAHLALVPWLFGWHDPGLTFDVALHVGTLAAVLIYFRQTWADLIAASLRALTGGGKRPSAATSANYSKVDSLGNEESAASSARENPAKNSSSAAPLGGSDSGYSAAQQTDSGADNSRSALAGSDGRLFGLLVLGTIPAGVIGLLLEKHLETTLRSPFIMGASLITVALLMAYADRLRVGRKTLAELRLPDVLTVGFAQALALIPGVSRSGITMTAGLFMQFQRDTAARFSFLLSTPIIAGACLKKLLDVYHEGLAPDMVLPFAVGTLTSALVGYATIAFFIQFLQFGTFRIFVYYRIVIGIIVLALATFYRLNLNP